jgi:hypothetical protein
MFTSPSAFCLRLYILLIAAALSPSHLSSPIFAPIVSYSRLSPFHLLGISPITLIPSARPSFLIFTPDISHPRMQDSAHHEHRAGKGP